jgi:hypothetical protein
MNDPHDRMRWFAVLLLGYAVWLLAAVRIARAAEPPESAGASVDTVRRFSLVVGANDGGAERVRLRFATSDADEMAKVLRDLGGVRAGDLLELRDPTPEELDSALRSIGRLLELAKQDGVRTQFVFYYSGHSDERGLLLGDRTVDYKTLRQRVQAVGADVRIAILDSCASGAFTRVKGGTRRAPFLAGSATKVEGHAFLTSSSADEAAQESDRVGGSFFTHFFATGLRGAADVDGDHMVTLVEAYEFAFDETLERTETSRAGAQHAAYDIQLAGSGDLVLTDLRKTSATLVLAGDIGGRVYVRAASGRLAAELYKPAGPGALDLALEPGTYQVTVDDGTKRRRGDVTVPAKGRVTVMSGQLEEVQAEATVRRGGAPPGADADALVEVPIDVGLLPSVSINATRAKAAGEPETQVRNRATFSLLWGRAARVDGVALGFGGSIVDEELHGVQGSFGFSLARGSVEGWQFSEGFNHAGSLHGVQTGVINHARTVEKGAQLGFVSVAGKVHGAQVGLVTYAEEADAAVGFLTITKKGNVHPEVFTSDVAAFNLGLRFPAKYTYSMVTFGVHPFGSGASWLAGFGLGGHIPLSKRAFLDIDLGGQVVLQGLKVTRDPAGLAQLRLMGGWQPLERLSLFGGPTLSVFGQAVDPDPLVVRDDVSRPGYRWVAADIRKPDYRIRVWPGFVAGLRF